ncbi:MULTISPECIES: hypothetical protein [unclassified Fibrobacter]|uniref:hypothetical protein n=1 Tax=unclassified Fibrobacter TaxID=2634177 RepID=UPI000D6D0F67|nr:MULTISPECIES: hypothetical protein [unclassified Fibrobacter]PWJ61754.1 hypothetical protein BGX12_12536 [Fibrobacter sp. UWR4]PZW67410.1 hypothetical protein C8E88_102536 [Fibrobacter sp. UWR1]
MKNKRLAKMAKIVKHMNKRTYTTGCGSHVVSAIPVSAISKIVDFIEAGPFGSALFLCGKNRANFSC